MQQQTLIDRLSQRLIGAIHELSLGGIHPQMGLSDVMGCRPQFNATAKTAATALHGARADYRIHGFLAARVGTLRG
ncbi:hypothetical protein D9M71_433000 [compost metagenome]